MDNKKMSWAFVRDVVGFLMEASHSTPEALDRLCHQQRQACLHSFPMDVVFQAMRSPLQNLHPPERLFAVPDDNIFFVDLLTERRVLSALEMRRYYVDLLCAPDSHVVVWMVVDAVTHACRGLLHLRHVDGDSRKGYEMDALFLSYQELQNENVPQLHETLLRYAAAHADVRGVELHLAHPPGLPLTATLCALLGFMANGGLQMVRVPVRSMVDSHRLMERVVRQVERIIHSRRSEPGDRKTEEPPPHTAATTHT